MILYIYDIILHVKVETVGKVYMVVGGAPEKNETHPKDIAIGILVFE